MKSKSYLFYLVLIIFGLSCARQVIPMKPVPTLDDTVYFEYDEMPAIVGEGETGIFRIKTTPGNECYAQIEYWDKFGVFRGYILPTITADSEGICNYEWSFDEDFDIRPGFARFLMTISQGEESANPSPYIFCAVKCP